jgi:hypothetical protein
MESVFESKTSSSLNKSKDEPPNWFLKLDICRMQKRLKILEVLTTLEERRTRGDLIQYFKINKSLNIVKFIQPNQQMHSINSIGPANSIRGGARHRLTNIIQRENFFANRIVPKWNKLPNEVVVEAISAIEFKNKYDKYVEANSIHN